MHDPVLDWHPARRQLRQFAWLAALFLAVLSWASGLTPWALPLRLAAALIFAVGTVLPGVLRWPYLTVLLSLYLLVRLADRVRRAFPVATRRPARASRPSFPPEHHDEQPATGTHG